MLIYKEYLMTCLILLLVSVLSMECIAQDVSKKWTLGLNYHTSSEMVNPGSKDYKGINLSVGRNILKHFTVGLTGTYFLPDDISSRGFHTVSEFNRKAGNIAVYIIGDIIKLNRLKFYGKTGVDYRIESIQGSVTIFNDLVGDPRYYIRDFNRTERNTGYNLGIGLEVKYKAIFFIEPSISFFDENPNFKHLKTGIKLPL